MSNADRIEELRSKYEENPRRYFAPLANEFRKAGDLTQAIAICREHLPKQPAHMSGYIVFGQTLYEAGSLDEARTVFEQALTLDPENLIALKHLGDIARTKGENSVARRWYERVLDADPRNDDIATQLASLSIPTPPLAMPAVAEPTPSAHRAVVAEGHGSFAAHGAGSAVDAAVGTSEPDHGRTDWQPRPVAAPRPVPVHEPIDLDFPESPEPAEPLEFNGEFEEGLMAPEWPDTSELVARVVTPYRSATPTGVPVSDEALSAFGRASHEPAVSDAGAPAVDLPFDDMLVEPYVPSTERPGNQEATATEATTELADAAPSPVAGWESATSQAEAEPVETRAPEWSSLDIAAPGLDTPAVDVEATVPAENQQSEPPAWLAETIDEVDESVTQEVPIATALHAESFAGFDDEEAAADDESFSASSFAETSFSETSFAELAIDETSFADVTMEALAETTDAADSDADQLVASATSENVHEENDLIDAEFADDDGALQHGDATVAAHESTVVDASAVDEPLVESTAFDHSNADGPAVHDATGDAPAVDDTIADSPAALFEAVVDEEEEPVASGDVPTPEVEPAPAFVTETMAELLVAQGFIPRAIEIYQELVRRRAYDPVLSSRLAELQDQQRAQQAAETRAATPTPRFATPVRNTPVYVTPQSFTPLTVTPLSSSSLMAQAAEQASTSAVEDERGKAFRTARERFAELARRRVPRRTPSHATAVSDDAADGLSGLFGSTAPATPDELAARALADAFGPVPESGESLFDIPESPSLAPQRGFTPHSSAAVPTSVQRAAEPLPRAAQADYSFDRFFPDPAVAPAGASGAASPASTTASEPATEDLAQFSAWLKGLNTQ